MFDGQFLQRATDIEEVAALTAQLVGIRSYPGGEGDVQRVIAAWLRANDVDAKLHDLGLIDRMSSRGLRMALAQR
jgi:hypothetical protein